jgi:hypothetical protein
LAGNNEFEGLSQQEVRTRTSVRCDRRVRRLSKQHCQMLGPEPVTAGGVARVVEAARLSDEPDVRDDTIPSSEASAAVPTPQEQADDEEEEEEVSARFEAG